MLKWVLFLAVCYALGRALHTRGQQEEGAANAARRAERVEDRRSLTRERRQSRLRVTRATRVQNRRCRPWQPQADAAPTRAAQETKPAGAPDLYFGW